MNSGAAEIQLRMTDVNFAVTLKWQTRCGTITIALEAVLFVLFMFGCTPVHFSF